MYYNLLAEGNRQALGDSKAFFLANAGKLVVLDEVQSFSNIFPMLKTYLEASKLGEETSTKFILLGADSERLCQLAAPHLIGRCSHVELTPFQLSELLPSNNLTTTMAMASPVVEETSSMSNTPSGIIDIQQRLWHRGGFPKSYLAKNDSVSFQWRSDFTRSLLEHSEGNKVSLLDRNKLPELWHRLALNNGALINWDEISKALNIQKQDAQALVNRLEKSHLIRILQPWYVNGNSRLEKRPKAFIRDTGLLHSRLGINGESELLSHRSKGESWEGFVIESLINAFRNTVTPCFYRSETKGSEGKPDEIDLVLEFSSSRRWAVEIKFSGNPSLGSGFYRATDLINAERRFVVHSGEASIEIGGPSPVEALTLRDAIHLCSSCE